MKLTSILAVTAAMFSMSALADKTVYGSNDFENNIGETDGKIGLLDTTWTQTGDDYSSISNYVDVGETPHTDIATGNTQYLNLATEGEVLSKALEGATLEGTSRVYVDSYVKLVGNEEMPTIPEDARIAVWLAKEEITVDALTINAGDLVVSAQDATNVISTAIEEGSWHRITIESSYDSYGAAIYFRVWLDGALCAVENAENVWTSEDLGFTADTAGKVWFQGYSAPGNANAISAVAFQGTGALDNLEASDTNPFGGTSVVEIFFGKEGVDAESALAWAAKVGLTKDDLLADVNGNYYNQYLLNIDDAATATFAISSIEKTATGAIIKLKVEGGDMNDINGVIYIKSADTLEGLDTAEEVEAVVSDPDEGDTEATITITTGTFFKAYVK